jgi:hypothetical protein
MNGLYGDVIPLATIELAKATLPNAKMCGELVRVVDAVSQKGAAVTLEFERMRCGPPGSPSADWRWEVVYCYSALAGRQLPIDTTLNHRSRNR